MHLRKKEIGKYIFHSWWTILSEWVWKLFTSVITFMLRCEGIIKPLSLWKSMGVSVKPQLQERRLMEQMGTSWVLFYCNMSDISLQPCSAGLLGYNRSPARTGLFWYFLWKWTTQIWLKHKIFWSIFILFQTFIPCIPLVRCLERIDWGAQGPFRHNKTKINHL